ncbi:MAG TPA: hypothetical protein VM821_05230 [Abditibacteriaceae bacterium]|nr:hypothetical protein [Abditibacteriaceae bacterium]
MVVEKHNQTPATRAFVAGVFSCQHRSDIQHRVLVKGKILDLATTARL